MKKFHYDSIELYAQLEKETGQVILRVIWDAGCTGLTY